MASYKGRGVVVKRVNFGEADRQVTVFSKEYSKITLLAKGARRPTSRLASAVNLFGEVEFVAARGKSLDILTEVKILQSHYRLADNLERANGAFWLGEVIERLVPYNEPHPSLYDLLIWALGEVNQHDSILVVDYFLYWCLVELGYGPEFNHCANCNSEVAQSNHLVFAPAAGGIVSDCCQLSSATGRPISVNALKLLRQFRQPWTRVARLKVPNEILLEAHQSLKDFTEYILQAPVKAEGTLTPTKPASEVVD